VAAGATKPLAAPKDDAEAFDLYRKDALGGDTEAQLKVGEMYETGQGVTQNNFQAYVWYGTAARGGNAAARPKLEQVAKKLQPAERQQADRLVERLARPPTR
jgi:TPR repeat protein